MTETCRVCIDYWYQGTDGKLKYEGKICPELADDIETQARKQKWLVDRTPLKLSIQQMPYSDLW